MNKNMKKRKIEYTNEPIGDLKLIDDFLPPPAKLVMREETVKVTLALTKESIEFFKKAAKKHHTRYQTMIRALLEQYTEHYRD
jgi:predicted DNA binding CopG/RHH family protein